MYAEQGRYRFKCGLMTRTLVFENASKVAKCNRKIWVHMSRLDEAHLCLRTVISDSVDVPQVHKPARIVLIQLQGSGVVRGRFVHFLLLQQNACHVAMGVSITALGCVHVLAH